MSRLVQLGVNAIIRPPRAEYRPDGLPGFIHGVKRQSISFKNSRGQTLVGSFFGPDFQVEELSCVIYLHGNASCQQEGFFLPPIFVPATVAVLCFDFSGCGASEGDFISLGLLERDDVSSAINYIRENFGVARVALWGRSMGAGTSFFALADDPTIACAVVDSAYASLKTLIEELARQRGVFGFITTFATWRVRKAIKEKAGFNINDVEPIKVAEQCFTPVLMIHGDGDRFIDCSHTKRLFELYAGENKEMEIVPGADHNSERPLDVMVRGVMFIARHLDAPIVIDDVQFLMSGQYHFAGLDEMIQDE